MYVTGRFSGTAIFGSTTLSSAGFYDTFVAKITTAGVWQWATRVGGSLDDSGNGIAVDASGNVYVTGVFSNSSINFGVATLTNTGGNNGASDIFVAKMTTAGVWQWATKAGGISTDESLALAVDGSGNLYVTGDYRSNTATFGTTTLTNAGWGDVFVAKLTTAGVWQWATGAGGNISDAGTSIAVDGSSNVYVTGYFQSGTASFGTTTLNSTDYQEAFVAKLTPTGNWQWATAATGATSSGNAVIVDGSGNAYVTGFFQGNSFSLGSTMLAGTGYNDLFVANLTSNGAWQWATRAGGSDYENGNGVALTGSGSVYVTGNFGSNTVNFGSTTLTNAGTTGSASIFISRLSQQVQPPTLTTFTATTGPIGASVTLTGTNLTGATAVSFNGTAATSFTVNSATQITATVPAGATTGPISVTTPGGTATSTTNFTVVSAPTITSFTPASGAAGATVTLTGTNLTGATSVAFGGVAASTFTVVSSTSVTAVVPSTAISGPISITTPGGTATSAASFLVLPKITSFTSASGLPGATVTITGTNFTGATAVKFNGKVSTFTVGSATSIMAAVPALATSGRITVTTPGGIATSSGTFYVAPIVTGFTPSAGSVGSVVILTGLNFTTTTTVKLNGVAATTTYVSATQLTAVVPAAATTGPPSAMNTYGTGTSAAIFTVTTTPTPAITSFTPTSGPLGTVVTITGTNLTGATAARFNMTNTSAVTQLSATQVQTAVPVAATTGKLGVFTPSGLAQTASTFTVIHPPTLTAFSPTASSPGALVTLTGTNLTGTTSVTFNGTPATSYTVVSATSITATVPVGATSGRLTATTVAGTAITSTDFAVTTDLPPVISSFAPATGPRGSAVVITGLNFTGTTTVKLGAVAGTFTVDSPTRITLMVPTTGVTGAISVTNEGGMVTSAASYTVILPPTITSFTPTSGPVGALVTINGTNLTGASAVMFGGVTAPSYTVVSSAKITATVPAGAATGAVSVTTVAGTASRSTFTVTASRPGPLVVARPNVTRPKAAATFGLYPNPAHQSAWVRDASGTTVQLLDGSGRLLRTARLLNGDASLDLNGIVPGIYTVRAGEATQKLVIE